MGNPIEDRFEKADRRPRFDPYTGQPLAGDHVEIPPAFQAPPPQQSFKRDAEPQPVPPLGAPAAVNPYAPIGWGANHREEFDVKLPSGQLCRVARLERDDLFRLKLMQYLDMFTPMLMEETISEEERNRRIRDKMQTDVNAVTNMFMAMDQVVMAATVNPRVTDNAELVDYGGPNDWANPKFVATAFINDITMDDRFAIFAAAFGRSMDDLKSLWEQAAGVAGVAAQPGVQQNTE